MRSNWSVEEPTSEDLAPEGAEHDCDGATDEEVDVLDFGGEAF